MVKKSISQFIESGIGMGDKEHWLRIIPVGLGCLLLVVGVNAHRLGAWLEKQADTPSAASARKIFTHHVARGLSIQSGAFPGTDLVRFESCRIEKQRKGGFSFGAFNVLVIDGLEVGLPPDWATDRHSGKAVAGRNQNGGAPLGLLEEELRRLLAPYPGFSGIKIHGLSASLIGQPTENGGSETLNILTARIAEGGRKRILKLHDCEFLTARGERIRCRKATLGLEWPFYISTDRGSFPMVGFVGGFNGDRFGLRKKQKETGK